MAGVNKAIIVGHLGADPEIRRSQSGKPVATFSVATSETWRDKATGERKEHTDWHRIVIFNEGLCDVAEKYLKKGSKVYLEGANKTRKWTDQSGADRYITEIVLSGFQSQLVMLDRAERAPAAEPDDYGSKPDAGGAKRDAMDDEIPF